MKGVAVILLEERKAQDEAVSFRKAHRANETEARHWLRFNSRVYKKPGSLHWESRSHS